VALSATRLATRSDKRTENLAMVAVYIDSNGKKHNVDRSISMVRELRVGAACSTVVAAERSRLMSSFGNHQPRT
jgi:hypothetical protein